MSEEKLREKGKYYRYIGETSRSAYERGLEHFKDLEYSRLRSHMLKPCVLKHQDMDPTSIKFKMKIVSSHKAAFERQIKEAVLIHRYSGPLLMNSKSEYNCCTIFRVSIKMGNRQEEHPEIELEQEVISRIKTLYLESKKRTSKDSEAVNTRLED